MATIDKRILKAFVRLDYSNRVVPTSLILRKNKPKVGRWVEVPAWECCNPIPTTTTTTTDLTPICLTYQYLLNARQSASLSYTNCYDEAIGPIALTGPTEGSFCALSNSIIYEGDGSIYVSLWGCTETTTTTTTEEPTTTTTTTI
jgi:hypothetical protein